MKEKEIRHPGVVTQVTPEYIEVEFITESACVQCHARSVCGAADSEKGSVQVRNRLSYGYSVGDRVNIVLKRYLGMRAVGVCYVIPLLLILVLLLSLQKITGSELVQGAVCLGVLALYYLGILVFRDRIEKSYEFVIEPENR